MFSIWDIFDRQIHTTDMFLLLGGIHSQNQGIYKYIKVYQGISRYIKVYQGM